MTLSTYEVQAAHPSNPTKLTRDYTSNTFLLSYLQKVHNRTCNHSDPANMSTYHDPVSRLRYARLQNQSRTTYPSPNSQYPTNLDGHSIYRECSVC